MISVYVSGHQSLEGESLEEETDPLETGESRIRSLSRLASGRMSAPPGAANPRRLCLLWTVMYRKLGLTQGALFTSMPVAVGFRHHVYQPPGVAAPLTGAFSFGVKKRWSPRSGRHNRSEGRKALVINKKIPPEPVQRAA